MAKLTLWPSGESLEAPRDKDLLTIMREAGVYVKSSCGGHATCSDCIIKVRSGEDNLTPPPFGEIQLLGNVFHITKERLSCQTYLTGDATIDISGHDKASDEGRRSKKTGKAPAVLRRPGAAKKAQEESGEDDNAPSTGGRRDFSKKPDSRNMPEERLSDKGFEKPKQDPNMPKKLGGGRRPKRR